MILFINEKKKRKTSSNLKGNRLGFSNTGKFTCAFVVSENLVQWADHENSKNSRDVNCSYSVFGTKIFFKIRKLYYFLVLILD